MTVTAKVWSNYDSVTEEFFWQPLNRLNDCGKLYLTPNQRRNLNSLNPELFQMMKVRLDVGTPFRTLFRVFLSSQANEMRTGYELEVNAREVADPNQPHRHLRDLVKKAMPIIGEDGLPQPNQRGLKLQDLDEIAKEFFCKEQKVRYQTKAQMGMNSWFHNY